MCQPAHTIPPHPLPRWIVVGAGTGGTSATVGRYIRYRRDALDTTSLCVVDPEGSVRSSATHMGAEYDSKVSTSLESGNVVYHGFPKGDMVVTPPVPMDWLIGA